MYYASFGWHADAEYTDFAEGYGFDVRQWSGYTVLRSVRELLMVTWLSQNAGTDPRVAEEVEKRVETLRSGGSRRAWAPFWASLACTQRPPPAQATASGPAGAIAGGRAKPSARLPTGR